MTTDDQIEKLAEDVQHAEVADDSGEEEGGDDGVVVDADAPKKKKSKILCIILYIDISCNTSHLTAFIVYCRKEEEKEEEETCS